MTTNRPAAVNDALEWLQAVNQVKAPFLPSDYAAALLAYIARLEAVVLESDKKVI